MILLIMTTTDFPGELHQGQNDSRPFPIPMMS